MLTGLAQWMTTFYRKLPIIRELIDTRKTLHLPFLEYLHEITGPSQAMLRMQQKEFVRNLLDQERYQDRRRLFQFEHQVFSQNGEDGVIAEIFNRIGLAQRTFVEIGVGNGSENNTQFLLSQGWTGCWVDGDLASTNEIRRSFRTYLDQKSLVLLEFFVTKDNIAPALRTAGVPPEIDLLSIDVDRNTFWIWEALEFLRPRVVIIEYNAAFPPSIEWKVPYEPTKTWDGSLSFGASLKAYELLGRRKGYSLVACEMAGVNAFFVRDDLLGDRFCPPYDAANHYEPPRYFLLRAQGYPRNSQPEEY